MRCFRSMHTVLRASGRLTVALGLMGFLVANTGLPVVRPLAQRGKDKSQPFLCQDRPCGCMSADECLRGCCCFSARERLAWAKANHVDAPVELLAQVADELLAAQTADEDHDHECVAEHHADSKQHASCCSDANAKATETNACAKCDHAESVEPGAVHHRHDGDDQSHEEQGLAAAEGWQILFIVGPLASQCRGLGPWSVLAFSALPPAAIVSYRYDWCSCGDVEPVMVHYASVDSFPPTRPPCL
jgi:hypothetical protein